MANYISLMTKEYGEGKICITTDRLSGYLTSHALASKDLWRKVLEWTGQRFNTELINVAVVNSAEMLPINYLDNFAPISYKNISLQDISTDNDLSEFDLIYFIGLPPLVADDCASAIEEYVENGGGILLEVPDRGGENINILRDIDYIYCASSNRPTYDFSYWTNSGKNSYVYSQDAIVNFYTTILFNDVNSDWDILMTDTPTNTPTVLNPVSIVGNTSAFITVGYSSVFKNGIVTLE